MVGDRIGEPIPRGNLPALSETQPSPPPERVHHEATNGWGDLVAANWELAFVPLLTWTSVLGTSLGIWQTLVERAATPNSLASKVK